MDWLTSFKKAIDYMETHMLSDIGAKDVADAVHISPSYFQKSFKIVTGYSIGEYLRNRRLYLAGMDVLNAVPADNSPLQKNPKALADKTVLDLAYKYGYDTPESFTKAFEVSTPSASFADLIPFIKFSPYSLFWLYSENSVA